MSWTNLAGWLTRPPTMREHIENNDRVAQAVKVVIDDTGEPFPELHHRTDQITEAVERLLTLHAGG